MKTKKILTPLRLPLLFLIIAALIVFSHTASSQNTETKEIVRIKVQKNGDQSTEKKVVIKSNDNGTATMQVYEDGKLTEEKTLDDMSELIFTDMDMDTESFDGDKQIYVYKDTDDIDVDIDKILESVKGSLGEVENIDVEEIMKKVEEKMEDLDLEGFNEQQLYVDNLMGDMNINLEELQKKIQESGAIIEDMDIDVEMNDLKDAIQKIQEEAEANNPDTKSKIIVIAKVIKIEDFGDDSPLDIKNNLKLDELQFYPNPSNGSFYIDFENPKNKSVNVVIYDLDGKELYSETISDPGAIHKKIESGIDKKGVYILKIEQGKKSISKKLIVE